MDGNIRAAGGVGATILTDQIAGIEARDPTLGAFQAIHADAARQAAQAADAARRSGGRLGPLHGATFALKDIVDLEGQVTTWGSAALAERAAPATGTLARRLLAAGGVLVGKTKTVECALGGWGTNQRMGTPWNPCDEGVHRAPGGSSSGSGVAVAAGMARFAVGTDTGGSVRLPAAFCGIVGLKVTEGRLPLDGIMPLSHTLDTPGPMTRSVADAALVFAVKDGAEGTAQARAKAARVPIHGTELGHDTAHTSALRREGRPSIRDVQCKVMLTLEPRAELLGQGLGPVMGTKDHRFIGRHPSHAPAQIAGDPAHFGHSHQRYSGHRIADPLIAQIAAQGDHALQPGLSHGDISPPLRAHQRALLMLRHSASPRPGRRRPG